MSIKQTILKASAMSVMLFMVSCSSSVPKWYLNPPMSEDVFYGVGDANRPQKALSKKVATARARDEVANAVEVKVSTMLKDFMQAVNSCVGKAAKIK